MILKELIKKWPKVVEVAIGISVFLAYPFISMKIVEAYDMQGLCNKIDIIVLDCYEAQYETDT